MHDLSEHIGTVLSLLGGLAGTTAILIGLLWKNLNTQLKEIKEDARKFSTWLTGMDKEGGIVSRESFFNWCADNRGKCPALLGIDTISKWRTMMLENGGVLTRMEHENLDDKKTSRLIERVEESLERHKIWVGDQIKWLQTDTENKILKELRALKEEIQKK